MSATNADGRIERAYYNVRATGHVARLRQDLALTGRTYEQVMTRKVLFAGGGLQRYEISNYAKPGFHSRHNALYWTGGEYLAGLRLVAAFDGRGTRGTHRDRPRDSGS